MGCDIHCYAEKRNEQGVYEPIEGVEAFGARVYGTFGFLADVRNYSGVTPIAEARGIPADVSEWVKAEHESWDCDAHSASWLSVQELMAFDYDAMTEDRRLTRRTAGGWLDGGCTADHGDGKAMTYREFLGEWFFNDLEDLKKHGAERIVFWFDN